MFPVTALALEAPASPLGRTRTVLTLHLCLFRSWGDLVILSWGVSPFLFPSNYRQNGEAVFGHGDEATEAERDVNPRITFSSGLAGPGDAVGARHDAVGADCGHGDEDIVAVHGALPGTIGCGTAGPGDAVGARHDAFVATVTIGPYRLPSFNPFFYFLGY